MPTITPDAVVWNNDAHTISLRIDKENLEISEVTCPQDSEQDESQDHPCLSDSRVGCVVKYFVNLYGFECNIGSCAPEPVLEISWCLQGSIDDIDQAQLWFVPVKDEVFYAWMTQRL